MLYVLGYDYLPPCNIIINQHFTFVCVCKNPYAKFKATVKENIPKESKLLNARNDFKRSINIQIFMQHCFEI